MGLNALNPTTWINEFLWSCAGVNKKLLRLCPTEYSKYAGAGGTILFTALMAMISGGYALYFVFNSMNMAIAFGIFWGLLIFNLDRFIVSSMVTDGTAFLSWSKIKMAAPRLIMAIFLGLVISTPLEMKIFEDRIESQLVKDAAMRATDTKSQQQDYLTLQTINEQYTNLNAERKVLQDELIKAQRELRLEAEGNALSGKAGHGPIYEDKKQYMEQCQTALDNWDKVNNNTLISLSQRMERLNTNINTFEGQIDQADERGFIARYEAFSNLKEENSSLAIISLFISLLFITIEVTPTLFKLIMQHGQYDDLVNAEAIKMKAMSEKYIRDINTESDKFDNLKSFLYTTINQNPDGTVYDPVIKPKNGPASSKELKRRERPRISSYTA